MGVGDGVLVQAAMELPPGTQVTTATQSDYRESEAQTAPYAPDYQIPAAPSTKQQYLTVARHLPEGVPEVLTLQHLKYTNGLPPGLAEVEMLEKARLKRAYEASLPPLHDAARLPLRQRMMEEWENAEWEAREQEIKSVQDERLEVLQVSSVRTRISPGSDESDLFASVFPTVTSDQWRVCWTVTQIAPSSRRTWLCRTP